ncbi:hypothetical protein JCM10450v2_007258 [Rhodotorula kratochvilovae]
MAFPSLQHENRKRAALKEKQRVLGPNLQGKDPQNCIAGLSFASELGRILTADLRALCAHCGLAEVGSLPAVRARVRRYLQGDAAQMRKEYEKDSEREREREPGEQGAQDSVWDSLEEEDDDEGGSSDGSSGNGGGDHDG